LSPVGPPVTYGMALALAGALAAASLSARHGEAVRRRLGMSVPGSEPARRDRGRLASVARGRGWLGDPRMYLAATLSLAVLGAVLGWRLAGPVGSIAGLVGGGGAVEWTLARRRARRREDLELQLREAVMALVAGVRAGLSIRRALEEAARDAGEPMRTHLRDLLRRLDVGEPLEAAMAGLASEIDSSEVSLLVAALGVHQRTGGELPAMLEEVAAIIGQRVDARRQVRALTAQGRASGAVLAVLPVAFVTLLSGTSGDGLGAFYRTPLGSSLLSAGLVCEVLGFLWIRRIVRIEA
jgi:tight adherence protein B